MLQFLSANNYGKVWLVQTFVYGDLYRYDVEKQEWKLISSPNSPPPRSAHQAVAWKNYLYIFGKLYKTLAYYVHKLFLLVALGFFILPIEMYVLDCLLVGGEFTSPNQERFHHYKVKSMSSCFFCFHFYD